MRHIVFDSAYTAYRAGQLVGLMHAAAVVVRFVNYYLVEFTTTSSTARPRGVIGTGGASLG